MTRHRVTTREAADILGISVEAVRKRIERGQLEHEREDNCVFVYLDEDQIESGHEVESEGANALVESLQDQVEYLRDQLEREREANRENRRLLAAALERIPAIELPSEPREFPETAADTADGTPFTDEERPQEAAQPRSRGPWWRRWFGE
jgi:hypothetical protein